MDVLAKKIHGLMMVLARHYDLKGPNNSVESIVYTLNLLIRDLSRRISLMACGDAYRCLTRGIGVDFNKLRPHMNRLLQKFDPEPDSAEERGCYKGTPPRGYHYTQGWSPMGWYPEPWCSVQSNVYTH